MISFENTPIYSPSQLTFIDEHIGNFLFSKLPGFMQEENVLNFEYDTEDMGDYAFHCTQAFFDNYTQSLPPAHHYYVQPIIEAITLCAMNHLAHKVQKEGDIEKWTHLVTYLSYKKDELDHVLPLIAFFESTPNWTGIINQILNKDNWLIYQLGTKTDIQFIPETSRNAVRRQVSEIMPFWEEALNWPFWNS